MSGVTRRRLGWVLLGIGACAALEGLLVDRYDVGSTGSWPPETIALLAAGGVAALSGAVLLRRAWAGLPTERALSAAARAWAPFLVALAVYLTAFVVFAPVETGDQPHYELEALSLAYDHDRDLTNDYATDARVLFLVPKGFDARHAYQYEKGGPFISAHNVGLPLLLAPAVPVAAAASEVNPRLALWPFHLELVLLAALAAQVLYSIMRRLSPGARWLRRVVWASVVFSPPLVVYAYQAFTEMPAALLALIAVYAAIGEPSRARLLGGAVAVAAMPWLHVRFLPLAALLALALAYRALPPRERVTPAAALRAATHTVLPLVISVAGLCAAFQIWYGSPLLDVQYSIVPEDVRHLDVYHVLGEGLWSSHNGWLPYAPVFAVALAALPLVPLRFGRAGWFALATGALYLAVVSWQGGFLGFSFPGRFEVVLMPFLAIPLLLLAREVRWGRWAFAVAAAVTLALTVAIVLEPLPVVAGVPNQTGPDVPHVLWRWFVDLWPDVSGKGQPDAVAVAAWTAALLAAAAAIARRARRPPRADLDPLEP